MLETLLERFRRGDRLALSRLVSLVARGERTEEVLNGVGPPRKPARVVAVHEWSPGDYEGLTDPITQTQAAWKSNGNKPNWCNPKNANDCGDTRHFGGSNYIFFDGHAHWLKPNAVEPCPPQSTTSWAPLQNNPTSTSGAIIPGGKDLPATFCVQ